MWSRARILLQRSRTDLGQCTHALRDHGVCAIAAQAPFERLTALTDEVRRIGWCLGVLGGAEILQERREPCGLRWMVDTVLEAARIRPEPGVSALPDLIGSSRVAREVSLVAGWCLLQARRVGATAVRWSSEQGLGRRSLVLRTKTYLPAFVQGCAGAEAAFPRVLDARGDRVVLEWSEEGG